MIDKKIIEDVAITAMAEIRKLPSDLMAEERAHVLAVVRFCDILAVRRHLDRDQLQMAAWLHDMGRYSGEDQGHSQRSAKIARHQLSALGLEQETIDAIASAIRYHTKKDRLHAEMDEALKDADCLAQREAGTLDDHNPYRLLRAERALFLEGPVLGDPRRCRQYLNDTLEGLAQMQGSTLDGDRVHDLRVACRRLRAVLGATKCDGEIIRPLKRLSRALEPAREAAVNLALARAYLGPKRLAGMKKNKRKEEKRASKLLQELRISEKDLREAIEQAQLIPLAQALERLDPKAILAEESWHERRVMIKHLRYAVESSLVRSRHRAKMIEVLKGLQDLYGEWHDLQQFLATAQLKKKERRTIRDALKSARKNIEIETTFGLFWVRYHL